MAALLLDGDEMIEAKELDWRDFPRYFVEGRHPDDLTVTDQPSTPEYIVCKKVNHNRLFVRLPVKISEGKFTMMTFLCGTSVPNCIYLSWKCRKLLSDRIIIEPDLQYEYLPLGEDRLLVHIMPNYSQNYNVLGLTALMKFGLQLQSDSFSFTSLPTYL